MQFNKSAQAQCCRAPTPVVAVLNIFCNHYLKARPREGAWLQLWVPINGVWKILMSALVPAISEPSRSFLVRVTMSGLVSFPPGREKWCRRGVLRAQAKVSSTIWCALLYLWDGDSLKFQREAVRHFKTCLLLLDGQYGHKVPLKPLNICIKSHKMIVITNTCEEM